MDMYPRTNFPMKMYTMKSLEIVDISCVSQSSLVEGVGWDPEQRDAHVPLHAVHELVLRDARSRDKVVIEATHEST